MRPSIHSSLAGLEAVTLFTDRKPRFAAMVLVASIAANPCTVAGQASPDTIHHRNDCRLAAQVLRTGEPSTKLRWSVQVAPSCARIGAATAAALLRLRSSSDTAVLGGLVAISPRVRDDSLFGAALNVSADPSATPEARVAALTTLFFQVTGHSAVSYQSIVRGFPSDELCPVGFYSNPYAVNVSTPLRASAAADAMATAKSVESSDAPPVVRGSASCVTRALAIEHP